MKAAPRFSVMTETPYEVAVIGSLSCDFRLSAEHRSGVSTIDAIAQEIAGRGQCRYGSTPSANTVSLVKSVVAACVASGKAIPFLCPWGSKKPLNTGIDVADLGALRMLECLDRRIKEYHAPGIEVVIRIEDVGGHYLFAEGGAAGRRASDAYVHGFQGLASVLGLGCITLVPESELMDETEYMLLAETFRPVIAAYVAETDRVGIERRESLASWKRLVALGWRGEIPVAQRDYYRHRYESLYPGRGMEAYTDMLATYLAGSLARHALGATGARKEWGKSFIQLNFCSPVPGMPESMTSRCVYYRTVPEAIARTHIPPWRARGYLKVEGDKASLKIGSWYDAIGLVDCSVRAERDGRSVDLLAPILAV